MSIIFWVFGGVLFFFGMFEIFSKDWKEMCQNIKWQVPLNDELITIFFCFFIVLSVIIY